MKKSYQYWIVRTFNGKDIRAMRNIYWEQTASIRIDNNISKFQNIKCGVISPDLFSLYSEIILSALENMSDIQVQVQHKPLTMCRRHCTNR